MTSPKVKNVSSSLPRRQGTVTSKTTTRWRHCQQQSTIFTTSNFERNPCVKNVSSSLSRRRGTVTSINKWSNGQFPVPTSTPDVQIDCASPELESSNFHLIIICHSSFYYAPNFDTGLPESKSSSSCATTSGLTPWMCKPHLNNARIEYFNLAISMYKRTRDIDHISYYFFAFLINLQIYFLKLCTFNT